MKALLALPFLVLTIAPPLLAESPVAEVRYKLSAGDFRSAVAIAEDYRRDHGADDTYWSAVGWLARGAQLLGDDVTAQRYVDELHHAIPAETEDLENPYGAAIEVESKLIAKQKGRGAAIRYLNERLAEAKAPSLRSRIEKNVNLLSLEGQAPPEIANAEPLSDTQFSSLASFKGRPALVFFWAWYCSDCAAQAKTLENVCAKYQPRGLAMLSVTRRYGSIDDHPATPAEEKEKIASVWKQKYPGLAKTASVISSEAMIRYGVSATPTLVLIDRKGIVRMYSPTRMSENELSQRIEELLEE